MSNFIGAVIDEAIEPRNVWTFLATFWLMPIIALTTIFFLCWMMPTILLMKLSGNYNATGKQAFFINTIGWFFLIGLGSHLY